jgi:hypothetical protein
MTNAIQTVLAGQNRFGLRKTFSWDGVRIQVEFFRNNLSASV